MGLEAHNHIAPNDGHGAFGIASSALAARAGAVCRSGRFALWKGRRLV